MVEKAPCDLKAPSHTAGKGLDNIVLPVFESNRPEGASVIRWFLVSFGIRYSRPWKSMFSQAVSSSSRLWSWNTIPIDFLTPSSSCSTSMPLIVAEPEDHLA